MADLDERIRKRLVQLCSQGRKVVGSGMTTAVDSSAFSGWRTASLSFLEQVFGGDSWS
jgi:hypothetical protein